MTLTYALDAPHGLDPAAARALLGGKAANLGVMARDLGLPVPPGFVITTDACRAFLAGGWPAGLEEELRARIATLEAVVGRRFGDPADPLLVSVRSGAPVSMPGMLDTILNLGLTDATAAGLARVAGGETFARSCRDRLAASFRDVVGVATVPDDPWRQFRLAIEAVFRSWNGERARAYRRTEGIADDLGTAVTVQAMVFGNRGPTSATGVLFTRNPATGEPAPYGDILFDAQGDDVVAGTHRTEPIGALDERLPSVAAELRDYAGRLERHLADLCDIEFTIEEGRLWMLQVRVGKRSQQAALRIAAEMAADEAFPLSRAEAVRRVAPLLADPPMIANARSSIVVPIATGLPASPGVASGPLVTDPEAALDAADAGRPAILVRTETSPDDVHGMARAAGILTARGGLASHAAVVARGWGIPAVVGTAGLEVGDGRLVVGDRVLTAGDVITIDGATGEVFAGAVEAATEVVPEARILLGWARELGIPIGDEAAESAESVATVESVAPAEPAQSVAPVGPPAVARRVTPDDCLRAVAIKGFAPVQGVADAVLADAATVEPVLDQLTIDGLLASVAGAYRLSEVGAARADALLAADRDAWGEAAAGAALDAFVELDGRVKATVTAWQLRDAAGQVVNDHTDPAYDRSVLDRLAAVHADALAWLEPLEPACRALGAYGVRLGRALENAVAGDGRYVASPRVDSYHGAWFELHEELIRLAGRSREEEAAAGRA
ncbi:MAG TPA: pyruvate, phosphate dikinase [Candidatus Limnocylindrales bacterium]|nr:pyruvate, phosphate dikinase [Candidatus Limnocylindrales bacterium]